MVSFKMAIVWLGLVFFQPRENCSEKEIVYARRDGLVLTMSLITPYKANRKAIVNLLRGGDDSDHLRYNLQRCSSFRGLVKSRCDSYGFMPPVTK